VGDVLVVDDYADFCQVIGRLLGRIGLSTDCAFGGRDALEYLRGKKPKLVLLDYMMPDLDGIEVLRRIRSHPDTADLPVVIFTALDDPQFTEYAISMGANACWVKTCIDAQKLGEQIRQLID
jgi:CheY-like chemotaxis protein